MPEDELERARQAIDDLAAMWLAGYRAAQRDALRALKGELPRGDERESEWSRRQRERSVSRARWALRLLRGIWP